MASGREITCLWQFVYRGRNWMRPMSGIEIIRRVICPVVGAFGRYVAAALQAAEFLWGCGYPGRRSFALRTHLPLGSHAPPLRGEGGRVLLGYYAPPLRGEGGP